MAGMSHHQRLAEKLVRSAFLLALGLSAAYPLTVAKADSVTLREECTRDRCVYYKGSTRQFSIEKETGTKRLILRDGKREVVAKLERQERGRIKVEKPRR